MKVIIIKIWRKFLKVYVPLSLVFNFLTVTIFRPTFQFISMPIPDREVTEAFQEASPDVVTSRTFSYKLKNRYYVLIETTKEGKERLEKLQKEK